MHLTYLGFRKEVKNCCLPFQDFKRRKNLQLIYFKVWLMSLVTKKQNGRNICFFFRINCSKQVTCDFLRGWNASSKVRLTYLEDLKDRKKYGWWFWRLNNINKVRRDHLTDRKTPRKVETKHLELKLSEA